ncbi:hypothetical protein D3C76_1331520 [compost metagenome]
MSDSGTEAQLKATKGAALRSPSWWMALARVSLPAPVSPSSSNGRFLFITLRIRRTLSCIRESCPAQRAREPATSRGARERAFALSASALRMGCAGLAIRRKSRR